MSRRHVGNGSPRIRSGYDRALIGLAGITRTAPAPWTTDRPARIGAYGSFGAGPSTSTGRSGAVLSPAVGRVTGALGKQLTDQRSAHLGRAAGRQNDLQSGRHDQRSS